MGTFSKASLIGQFGIELIDRLFNNEQWHESKVKYLIWDDLLMYAKVAWERVVNFVKISIYLAEALRVGFDQTRGDMKVLCRHNRCKSHGIGNGMVCR